MLNPFKGSRVQTFKDFGFVIFFVIEFSNALNLEKASAALAPGRSWRHRESLRIVCDSARRV